MANHLYFEKKRWSDLHMSILDDDGIARIAEKLQALKTKMDDKFYLDENKHINSPEKPVEKEGPTDEIKLSLDPSTKVGR